jgi:hypothetical protein
MDSTLTFGIKANSDAGCGTGSILFNRHSRGQQTAFSSVFFSEVGCVSDLVGEAAPKNLFAGDSEMAMRMRSHDWSQTSLGAVETWSDSLKTAWQILLTELDRTPHPEKTQLESNLPQKRPSTDALHQTAQAEAFRVRLTNALRPLTDANEIQATAARILGDSIRGYRS